MAAEPFVAQELPSNMSASAAMRVDDAAYMARIGLTAPAAEATPEAKPEVKPEVKAEIPKADTVAPEIAVADEPAADATVEAEPVVEPEKVVELPPLATEFQIYDDEGELEIPRNLKIKFRANKKDYEIPLDKTVQFAQQGVYNHEKQQEIEAKAKAAEQVKVQADLSAKQVANLESYYEELFKNPDFYERAREIWAKDQTPEARAAKAEQALAQRDQQDLQRQYGDARQQFVANYLTPKMQSLLTENPTVKQDELIGRWSIMTAPMMVSGAVPVERLQDVQTLAENQLTHWVRSVHLERSAEATSKTKEIKDAKAETIKAKRSVARVSSAAGATGTSTPQPKQYKSAKDWFNGTFSG